MLFVLGHIAAYLVSTVSTEPLFSHLFGIITWQMEDLHAHSVHIGRWHATCWQASYHKFHLQGVWLAKLVNDSEAKTMVLYGTRAETVHY